VCIARQRVYTCYADHAAGVLGYTFAAEEEFAGRALRHGFAEVVMEAALVD
jgi:hypothetical protein